MSVASAFRHIVAFGVLVATIVGSLYFLYVLEVRELDSVRKVIETSNFQTTDETDGLPAASSVRSSSAEYEIERKDGEVRIHPKTSGFVRSMIRRLVANDVYSMKADPVATNELRACETDEEGRPYVLTAELLNTQVMLDRKAKAHKEYQKQMKERILRRQELTKDWPRPPEKTRAGPKRKEDLLKRYSPEMAEIIGADKSDSQIIGDLFRYTFESTRKTYDQIFPYRYNPVPDGESPTGGAEKRE